MTKLFSTKMVYFAFGTLASILAFTNPSLAKAKASSSKIKSISYNLGGLSLNTNQTVVVGSGTSAATLDMQGDGNLVVYQNNTGVWSTGTYGNSCASGCTAIFQGDGNFVVYSGSSPVFSSNTAGTGNKLIFQNSAPYLNILNSAGKSIWASSAAPAPTPTPVPTPKPTPVPTPVPTPKPTPVPTPVPTPKPTPIPTPVPTPKPTPVPTPTPTPVAGYTGILWGANGHNDQGTYAPSGSVSVAQQISDLTTVFGTSHGQPLYRMIDGDDTAVADIKTLVTTLQNGGINPIVVSQLYPSYANETAAYNGSYSAVQAILKAVPTIQILEIGNEWTLQMSPAGDGSTAADWTSNSSYSMFRGVIAGAVAAARATNSKVKVIGGATSGWTYLGLPLALAADLKSYKNPSGVTANLMWDYTNLHWYNDADAGNTMGLPSNFNGGMNAYKILQATGKPLCITEFGSSSGNTAGGSANSTGYETQAGKNIVALMADFVAHQSTENGVACATTYQLYQEIQGVNQYDYFLYYVQSNFTTVLAPQGQAMQSYLLSH